MAERAHLLQVIRAEETQLYLTQDAQRHRDRRRRHRDRRCCHGGRRRRAAAADGGGAGRAAPRDGLIRGVRGALLDVAQPDVARGGRAAGLAVVDLRQDHR